MTIYILSLCVLAPECIDDADALSEASNGLTSDCGVVIGMVGCDGDALDGSGRKVSDVCCASCTGKECVYFCHLKGGALSKLLQFWPNIQWCQIRLKHLFSKSETKFYFQAHAKCGLKKKN